MMPDSWNKLRRFTAARVAIGRAGGSAPTREVLKFRLDHARARDAVLAVFDIEEVERKLSSLEMPVLKVQTRARDRGEYLLRPDNGRRLDAAHAEEIAKRRGDYDLVIVISDGLSSLAAERQSARVCEKLIPSLEEAGWKIAPLVIAEYGRVALQDEVGELIGAKMSLMLIGERPGLGSPDSLGAYFTYGPVVGNTDAQRNCVSNIRPEGLPPEAAAKKLFVLMQESLRRRLSGVELKDETILPDRVAYPSLPG